MAYNKFENYYNLQGSQTRAVWSLHAGRFENYYNLQGSQTDKR